MVFFPGIGLEFNISRIAFKVFGVNIYWYGIIIVSAIVIALLLLKKDKVNYGIDYGAIIDLAIILIPVSIISARLYYVLFDFQQYQYNIAKVFDFRTRRISNIWGNCWGCNYNIYIL